jgi:hypothetical protein
MVGDGAYGLSLIAIPDPQDVDGIDIVLDLPCIEGLAAIE